MSNEPTEQGGTADWQNSKGVLIKGATIVIKDDAVWAEFQRRIADLNIGITESYIYGSFSDE